MRPHVTIGEFSRASHLSFKVAVPDPVQDPRAPVRGVAPVARS